jgi:16S rRNA (guanine966-N2)-methyltransferase
MRIIAGQWRGRPLVAPAGDATRPTADRTRETLFSMLTSRLGSFDELTVGDFFAGSGALGFEALSRGAASCMFVERDRDAVTALKNNAAKLGLERPDIRQADVLALGRTPKPLDIIFMDPPYGTGAGAVALDKLARMGWIGPSTWVSIETGRTEEIAVKGFEADAERVVGKAKLHILRPIPAE